MGFIQRRRLVLMENSRVTQRRTNGQRESLLKRSRVIEFKLQTYKELAEYEVAIKE